MLVIINSHPDADAWARLSDLASVPDITEEAACLTLYDREPKLWDSSCARRRAVALVQGLMSAKIDSSVNLALLGRRLGRAFGIESGKYFDPVMLKLDNGKTFTKVLTPHPHKADKFWNTLEKRIIAAGWWKTIMRAEGDIEPSRIVH